MKISTEPFTWDQRIPSNSIDRGLTDWLWYTPSILSRIYSDGKEQSRGGGNDSKLCKSQGCALTATKGNCVLVCISKNTASKQVKGSDYSTQHLLEHSCSTMSNFASPPCSFRGPLQNWRESSKGPAGWELDIRKKFYLFSLEEAARGYLITVFQYHRREEVLFSQRHGVKGQETTCRICFSRYTIWITEENSSPWEKLNISDISPLWKYSRHLGTALHNLIQRPAFKSRWEQTTYKALFQLQTMTKNLQKFIYQETGAPVNSFLKRKKFSKCTRTGENIST